MSINIHVNLSIAVGGTATATANFGVPIYIADHAVTANRQDGPYSSLSAVETAGFTSGAAADIHAWATRVFAQRPRTSQVMIGRIDGADPDLATSLSAIEAVDPAAFYALNMASNTDADIEDLADWVESRSKIAIAQTSSSDLLAGSGGNIGETLRTGGYNRTALVYHDDDTEHLDAAWTGRCLGFNLDAPEGAGSWAYHRFAGITATALTDVQKSNLLDENANYYAPVRYTSGVEEAGFVFPGTMGSGRFIDVTTTIDVTQARLEEALLGVFLGAASSTRPKIPYTDKGLARLQGAAMSVFRKMIRAGHFVEGAESETTGRITPWVDVPSAAEVSSAVKQGRTVTMQAEAIFAGAVNSIGDQATVGFSIDLNFA